MMICIRCRVSPLSPLHLLSTRGYHHPSDNHYSLLGVKPDASPKEIKIAYLALSKQLHPDLNQGKDDRTEADIHQKFVQINEAYAVLNNKQSRAAYDLEMT